MHETNFFCKLLTQMGLERFGSRCEPNWFRLIQNGNEIIARSNALGVRNFVRGSLNPQKFLEIDILVSSALNA
jgi:hypothetical protein